MAGYCNGSGRDVAGDVAVDVNGCIWRVEFQYM